MKKIIKILIFLSFLLGFSGLAYLQERSEEGLVIPNEEIGAPEIVYNKPVKGVLFSHKYHVGELGLSCESCHPKLFEMQALKAQENPDFNMNALYQGKYCGACHDGKMAFASNTKCATCHIGVKGLKRLEKEMKTGKK
ncbi:MAG: cytochrome c3 family protein [Thermodesulfobacteriaceae bacterium]|nr:cytochrome c3 family protein [Thermodesulfobacteriaceae bacterium]MCX8042186.1 cytochrome c3 family protein [Thermodesulfobacteriaceae bacterium]MDW8135675.1 cytochrome c3 family protein [Thermodesulfobacterium sp.]